MKVCVSCQTDVGGKRAVPIKEDRIIRTIRSVKRSLGVAQNNELYVCEACLPKHNERRKSFEKTMLFASVFAGLMLVIILVAPVLSGRIDPWAIISGFIVAGFILALPIFKYAPAAESLPAPKPNVMPPPVPPVPPVPVEPQIEAKQKKKTKKRR